MGSGSGIQAETCLKLGFKKVLCADIDKESLEFLKNQKLKTKKSNLFSNIKSKFDLIIFNPPYLPEDKFDKQKDTTGGKKGDETILRFLKQAKNHLKKDGKILLVLSSFTPKTKINQAIRQNKYKKIKLAEKNIFFEKLFVYEIFLQS